MNISLHFQANVQKNKNLTCTWGKKGAYALLNTGELIHQDTINIDNPIDTIGAGDTFNAGIINSRLNNMSWRESLKNACQLAAKKCQQMGFDSLI